MIISVARALGSGGGRDSCCRVDDEFNIMIKSLCLFTVVTADWWCRTHCILLLIQSIHTHIFSSRHETDLLKRVTWNNKVEPRTPLTMHHIKFSKSHTDYKSNNNLCSVQLYTVVWTFFLIIPCQLCLALQMSSDSSLISEGYKGIKIWILRQITGSDLEKSLKQPS